MRIAVGSTNPVKRHATERIAGELATSIDTVSVESGVPDQPRSETETLRGANNRAIRSLEAGDYDIGVGIEGGVGRVPDGSELFLTMWAVVTDGHTVGQGAGPRLLLPAQIASRVEDGEELGPVMDDILDTSGIAEREGAAGVLTNHLITRESALAHAVAGAFGPFVSEYY
jgi:inosine/xanthosine triphosphatase